ncbi:MAG TPA: nucleotidyltransferase family protein [Candidatus Baltobacteraceae bacterium]|jgi:GTP:adenosylcobinamide-phosphate guanylyltransferase|nr:nucleotidyltransferase family protein [Candidatus Baltobacteraceae bacterium]
MNAVVLAGGPHDAVAALESDAPNKAFVRIGGVALVTRVLSALRATPAVTHIIVVTPPSMHGDAAIADADECRPDGVRMADSLRSGIHGLPQDERVLIVPSDLPFVTREALEEFIRIVGERDPDLAYACLERTIHEATYPGAPHTWARLREGSFCGGGAIALKPSILDKLEGFLDRLGAARKNPLRLAALFGWDVLLRFALGNLDIADVESRASSLLGARAIGVPCGHAEIAFNIDRVSDVPLAESFLPIASSSRSVSDVAVKRNTRNVSDESSVRQTPRW